MDKVRLILMSCLVLAMAAALLPTQTQALVPYPRSIFDMMFPQEDPFKILEQAPLTIPKGVDTLALAQADWKETPTAHIISIDIPGMKKEDVSIEVEENRVLRVSGERRTEEEVKDEKWHRAERTSGKFWRQFRLPANADMEKIKAHMENGVLRITVPKLAEEKKREPKVISIAEEGNSGQDIKANKAEL
ncbi:22.0 kDa heat shock protein [Abeliophyllum distichum]|uniref:22.0 kDa heat shock protein n=1 Tax=Abeliophyllum distichum TaxID=126358 RepID=A0ABD1PC01_9LAMI